jgi:hypothetical protein
MFDAFETYAAFLDSLAPAYESAGFKRVKGGFRRRTKLAVLNVGLGKGRDTRRDCLICNLGGWVNLPPLDPYFRAKDCRDSLSGGKDCDFWVSQFHLTKALGFESGCWRITSDAELAEAIALGQRFAAGLLCFFELFESEAGILARLQEHFLTKGSTITGQLRYPAYLLGTGRPAEFDHAFGQLLQLYADDESFLRALGFARRKIVRIAGIEHA